jgi:formate dehydrogenase subunit gamma
MCKRVALFIMLIFATAFAVADDVKSYEDLITKPVTQRQAMPAAQWGLVGDGIAGVTNSKSPEAGVMVNTGTIAPLEFRQSVIIPANQWAYIVVILLVFIFFIINGSVKVEDGFSGVKILRWPVSSRIIHWGMAASFIVLGLTGLSIMIGRFFIRSYLSPETWGNYMEFCDLTHDFTSPLFVIFWLLAMVKWMHHQFPEKHDLQWLKSGGGFINRKSVESEHAPAGFSNAGEKILYWLILLVGIGIISSGIILLFQNLTPTRDFTALALVVHGLFALGFMILIIGHISMAVLLVEGGFESMQTGYCDENWAKQHHNLWYQEITEKEDIKYKP